MVITQKLAQYMTAGSAIYSTGGGIEEDVQNNGFATLIQNKRTLTLVSLHELAESAYVCTAYAVGSAGDTSSDLSELLKIGLSELERCIGKPFAAVFPGETNADILAFQAASALSLPVLDADCTGGRAVPEIVQDNFTIVNRPVTPLVAVDKYKKIHRLTENVSPEKIEEFVRRLASKTNGLIAVLDHPIMVKDARSILTLGVLTRSIRLGKIRYTNTGENRIKKMLEEISGEIICTGKVTDISLSHNTKKGFLEGTYTVIDPNKSVKIAIKNENLFCVENGKLLVSSPDAILLIDQITGKGIHNSTIQMGQRVIVIKKIASDLWNSTKGKEIFSPEHFGLEKILLDA